VLTGETRKNVEARLKRIAGQVAGLSRMVEDERYCVEILLQIAAVQAALGKVGKIVLGSHVEKCVTQALTSGDEEQRRKKLEELMEVFSRFGHIRDR